MMTIARSFLALMLVLACFAPIVSQAEEKLGANLEQMLREMLGGQPEAGQSAPAPQLAPSKRVPFGRAEMQLSFAPLVSSAAPSVVNVYTARIVKRQSPFLDDPFFGQFFGDEQQPPQRMQNSLGSGVLVDPSGIIVTNNHVIRDADEVKIALADGREFECKILLKDERSDLAVLKINANERFPSLNLADSDAIEVGDLVLAIGNPFGVGQTTTSGIISALARNQVGVSDFGFFIQTDAAINPGNSGGALLNMAGEVIGINTAIFSKSGGSVGIGFAIPSNMVRAVVNTAESGGSEFNRPFIGASFEPVSSEIAESLGMNRPVGALVTRLVRGGAAEKGGLKVGDVVLKMDGFPVEHPDALGYRLSTKGIGKVAKLEVLSRNQRRLVSVMLERASAATEADEKEIDGDNPFSGAVISNISPQLAEQLRMPPEREGVVVTKIKRGSPAMGVGIRPGDVILELNGETIADVAQMAELVEAQPTFWRFKIDRGGQIIRQFFR
jgi:Do/DeqQ family serine protease